MVKSREIQFHRTWAGGDYKDHQDRKKKQVLPKESNESLKEVSERGCEISILGDAQNSIQVKSWAIWSNVDISLELGREWGLLAQVASKGPSCPTVTCDCPIPNFHVPVAGGASWTTSTGLYLATLHVLIPFYEFVHGFFWNIKTSATHHHGAKCSAACLCCQLPPSAFMEAACFLGCLLPPMLWNKINGTWDFVDVPYFSYSIGTDNGFPKSVWSSKGFEVVWQRLCHEPKCIPWVGAQEAKPGTSQPLFAWRSLIGGVVV